MSKTTITPLPDPSGFSADPFTEVIRDGACKLEEMDGDYGAVRGLVITCTRCRHSVEAFGTEENSVKRGAVMLRDECPFDEDNFYSA